MHLELQAFDHVHVYVTDRAKAEVWYRDVLHLHRSEELEFWSSDGGPLTIQNRTGSIHIALFERPAQPCRSVVAIRVSAAGYAAWKTRLEQVLPGDVSEQDHEASLSLYFRDPDGNPYELTTYEVEHLGRKASGPPSSALRLSQRRATTGSELSMYEEVLDFWFVETSPRMWWTTDSAFDAKIAGRFGTVHTAAIAGELAEWRGVPRGRLAEIIVLDQFSRNLFRGTPRAFVNDPMALVLAQEAVAGAHDRGLTDQQRSFLYMPFMHSESRSIHAQAERLFASLDLPDSADSARRHRAIIDRFGRYPHRNAILGRESTAEELAFLQQPGSRF